MRVEKTVKDGKEIYEFFDATPEELHLFVNEMFNRSNEQEAPKNHEPVKNEPTAEECLMGIMDMLSLNYRVDEHDKFDFDDFGHQLYVLYNLNTTCPGAFLNLCMTVVAKYLDYNYPNHISDAPSFWVYTTTDGKLHEMQQSDIRNKDSFKYFAAFRSQEDALKALKIVNEIKRLVLENA